MASEDNRDRRIADGQERLDPGHVPRGHYANQPIPEGAIDKPSKPSDRDELIIEVYACVHWRDADIDEDRGL